MKNIKKLLSIVMVLTLVLSLGASAFAVDITINDENGQGSTYAAYQIFTAQYVREDSKGDVYKYGFASTGMKNAVAEVLKSDKMPTPVTTYNGHSIEKPTDPNAANYETHVMEYLSGLKSEKANDGETVASQGTIRTFADLLYAQIKNFDPTQTISSPENTFQNLPDGYYMIVETTGAGADAAASLVMLDTAGSKGNITVYTKEDKPTSDKSSTEKDDTNGTTDSPVKRGDWDIGDHIPYVLTAKIQDKHFSDYETYYLQFADDMSKALTLDVDTVVIKVNGQVIDKNAFTYAAAESNEVYEGGMHYTWTCEDITKLPGVAADCTITIEYTATLNEAGAVYGGTGNPNTSHIEFSNNPYNNSHGKTPDKKVTVFTFKLVVDKQNGVNQSLAGAAFTLLKKLPSVPEGKTAGKWEDLKGDGLVAGGYYQKGDDLYQIVGTSEAGDAVQFTFNGLDVGEYILVETVVPEGYNKAEDIPFEVTAEYESDGADGWKVKTLTASANNATITAEASTGTMSTTVINLTGLELPSTGGIGTTIFYVVGAILVAGAVILLVTKKRASDASK